MLSYILFAVGYAFSAVIQPGPLQAFLLSKIATIGWKRTLPASLSPLISDIPIAFIAIFLLSKLSAQAQYFLQFAGGILLLYFAWSAALKWRKPARNALTSTGPKTLFQAVLVNVLNPHPYLGWAFVLGPKVHTAFSESPVNALVLLLAFYGTMVLTLAGFICIMGKGISLGSNSQRRFIGISALLLFCLGLYLFVTAGWHLFSF